MDKIIIYRLFAWALRFPNRRGHPFHNCPLPGSATRCISCEKKFDQVKLVVSVKIKSP